MKAVVATSSAPQAIGPYSQAVRAGDWLFLSGQIGLDPVTGDLVAGEWSSKRNVYWPISSGARSRRSQPARRRADDNLPGRPR